MNLDNNSNDHYNDDDRPKTPLNEDCCGNGCVPCIFDVHKRLLSEWENRKAQDIKVKITSNLLSPLMYKAFVITDISETSEDYILVCLEYQGTVFISILFIKQKLSYVIIKVQYTDRTYYRYFLKI